MISMTNSHDLDDEDIVGAEKWQRESTRLNFYITVTKIRYYFKKQTITHLKIMHCC